MVRSVFYSLRQRNDERKSADVIYAYRSFAPQVIDFTN